MPDIPPRHVRRLDGLGPGGRGLQRLPAARAATVSQPPRPLLATSSTRQAETFATTKAPKRRLRKIMLIGGSTVATLVIGAALVFGFLTPSHNKISVVKLAVAAAKAAVVSYAHLQGQSTGRTNVVIFGMTKDGLRTDSIMLASYYWKTNKLVTLNIPRDLYVYDGYENCKMGEVYAYAKAREPHNPTYPDQYVIKVLEKEYNVSIPYWVQFNMMGEVALVNAIGGIDINVPVSFTDYEYPTWNYTGYMRPAPSFQAGEQHMDGARALIYSRSRHSLDNGQGSDFARSKRQQAVLAAVMNKVKQLGIVGNLAEISKYLTILGNNVATNLTPDEQLSLAHVFHGMNPNTDYIKAIWATGNGFLCNSTSSYGAYIILYGVTGDCHSEAGTAIPSTFRTEAIRYVDNLYAEVGGPGRSGVAPSSLPTANPEPTSAANPPSAVAASNGQ